jgi:hypothetical protein
VRRGRCRTPLGKVPLVELSVNMPIRRPAYGGGTPEFQKQIVDQRRINQTVLDMLITMEHQAFRQRWVVGWDPPVDKKTGEVDKLAAVRAGAAALMIFNNKDTKVGEFSQADFQPFLAAVDRWVKKIASTGHTPPYAFLLGDMINVAADSLARIEGQLTTRIEQLGRQIAEDLEEAVRLALEIEDNPKAADMASSVMWADAQERTATEQIAVAQAYKAAGAPDEEVFAALPGVEKQQAHRWADLKKTAPPDAAPIRAPPAIKPSRPTRPRRPDATQWPRHGAIDRLSRSDMEHLSRTGGTTHDDDALVPRAAPRRLDGERLADRAAAPLPHGGGRRRRRRRGRCRQR